MDEDAVIRRENQVARKSWLVPEQEKRKLGEQEERCAQTQKRIRRDDIRYFLRDGVNRAEPQSSRQEADLICELGRAAVNK